MDHTSTEQLKKTPLNARHRALGARMVPFSGWDMPVEYSGIVNEHLAVRSQAGLFDVSHMGQIEVAGEGAPEGAARFCSNDSGRPPPRTSAHYSTATPTPKPMAVRSLY